MSKISDFIRNEYEEHQKILQETDEDAHAHTLWIRRMESQQAFLKEHFPDNHTTREMIGMIQRMRQLAGKALESKE